VSDSVRFGFGIRHIPKKDGHTNIDIMFENLIVKHRDADFNE